MIRLLPLDEPDLLELLRSPELALAKVCSNAPEIKSFLMPLLQQSLDFQRRVGSRAPWHGYLAVESEGNRVVGICAFVGNPTASGEVEIAYGTVPGLEGRGYATRMAEALQELAFHSPIIRGVFAHTLPEPNASTRVLTKAGLTFAGEVLHPEDGRVWRWERQKPESTGAS
jgi:[ribosomal protein S5]-alanine N-acetyltransferase